MVVDNGRAEFLRGITMKRLYQSIIEDHFEQCNQMLFLCGPRQVGKTTLIKAYQKEIAVHKYFNWDNVDHRDIILSGVEPVIQTLKLDVPKVEKPLLVFDEIHKYKQWKNYIKGLYDEYKGRINIIVTGSAKLNVFRKGGDSLMGRYFLYRMHPLTVGELLRQNFSNEMIAKPKKITNTEFKRLIEFGGYPEPFIKKNLRFYQRWQNLRREQLIHEDIRNLAQVQELAQLEVLARLLANQTGQLVNNANLAKKIRVSEKTISRWFNVLEDFYYCFRVRPWSKNVSRSLIKEPKVYCWDWALVNNDGARIENFVASHLLKTVHLWTDAGFGEFELYFLRDKDQKEVDFLIAKDGAPWIIIEVKKSDSGRLSKCVQHFQKQLKAPHVFQVAFDLPYLDIDCFKLKEPKIVPASTLLSQLF
jgi:uncharacterized protein